MFLITTYFIPKDENRLNEINTCLRINIENPLIKRIFLLLEKNYDIPFINSFPKNLKDKVTQIRVSKDPNYILTFKDAFDFCNKYCKNKICIISNSDIYFDNSLNLLNNYNFDNTLLALLRWNVDENGNSEIFSQWNVPRNDSQDTWIFKSPISFDTSLVNFSLGTLGCDNILASTLFECDIKVTNPALSIKTYHLHNVVNESNDQTFKYHNRIHGLYALLQVTDINHDSEITFMEY